MSFSVVFSPTIFCPSFQSFLLMIFSTVKDGTMKIKELVIKPENSIIHQSRDAGYHPGVQDDLHKRNIRVNGDGFGIAWYSSDLDCSKGSCLFRFVTPAWSNENLRNICDHISSPVFFAHVRAASNGLDYEESARALISSENCHPFKYKRYTFVHNGGIAQFHKIKRALINLLHEDTYDNISGSTDSEHIFALFLTLLPNTDEQLSIAIVKDTMNKTINAVIRLCCDAQIHEPSSLNLVCSDGRNVIATRFRTGVSEPPSLYYNYGAGFGCEGRDFSCKFKNTPKEIVIASAPLSWLGADDSSQWHIHEMTKALQTDDGELRDVYGTWVLVPKDYMLVCEGNPDDMSKVVSVAVEPIRLENSLNCDRFFRSLSTVDTAKQQRDGGLVSGGTAGADCVASCSTDSLSEEEDRVSELSPEMSPAISPKANNSCSKRRSFFLSCDGAASLLLSKCESSSTMLSNEVVETSRAASITPPPSVPVDGQQTMNSSKKKKISVLGSTESKITSTTTATATAMTRKQQLGGGGECVVVSVHLLSFIGGMLIMAAALVLARTLSTNVLYK